MKLVACLWISVALILTNDVNLSTTTHWNAFVSSQHYLNTRLVTGMANPFDLLTVSKENPLTSTRIRCSQFCANNATCFGFNFYTTSSKYVCEFLQENFCFHKKRVVLQVWPGGNVWDKLSPGITKACVDQELENSSTRKYCDIIRPGCGNETSLDTGLATCSSCCKTCVDCAQAYTTTNGTYECTLWPDGPYEPPIFVLCYLKSVYLALRKVDPSSGEVTVDYLLTPKEMHRISRLNVYKTFYLGYISTNGFTNTPYLAYYANFYIDVDGSLMNMTFTTGNGGDGFNTGNTPLKPSPWVETSSNCGSFWFLNSTQPSATMECPGGSVGMFGTVNISNSPNQTGFRWPKATADNNILNHGDIKLTL